MPAPLPELVVHACELLAPLGAVRVRRMFGGHGLYADDVFIALIAFDRLFLKVDDTTRAQFEAAGTSPFRYEARGRVVELGYRTAPDDAMESPALMLPWARLAMGAALRARQAAAPAARKPRKLSRPAR